jgi:hypothetical protein
MICWPPDLSNQWFLMSPVFRFSLLVTFFSLPNKPAKLENLWQKYAATEGQELIYDSNFS